jgi:D-alanyl-D-alanine dipeptidase
VPGRLGHPDTVGLITVTNSSADTLTVDDIDLANQRGIRLVGADITPGAAEAGTWATFPPPAAPASAYLDWSKHAPAAGDRISRGQTVSITLGIEPTRTGISRAPDVEALYHDGGSHYDLRTNLALRIAVSPAKRP